jgi:hypothetical protein
MTDYAKKNPATSTVLGGLGLLTVLAVSRGRAASVSKIPFGDDFLKVTFKETPKNISAVLNPEAKIDKIVFPNGTVAKNITKSWYGESQWLEYTPWWKKLGSSSSSIRHDDQYQISANGLERISPLRITQWGKNGRVDSYENTRMLIPNGVSPNFANKIHGLFKTIPEELRTDLVKNRVHYRMDSNILERNPHIARTTDRDIEGIVVGGNNVHLAEYLIENGVKKKVPDEVIAYTFNHETGHTLNNTYDLINHPTLRGAYIKDIRNNVAGSSSLQRELDYFLQTPKNSAGIGSDTGFDELLADCFSITRGTGSFHQRRLTSTFPTVFREYPAVLSTLGRRQF